MSEYMIDVFNMKMGIRLDKYSEDEYKSARRVVKGYTPKQIARFLGLIEEALRIKDKPRYALTLLTLKMGYPDYINPSTEERAEAEMKTESRSGMNTYQKKSIEHKKRREENVGEVDASNLVDDLMNLIPGVSQVDQSIFDDLDKLDKL